MALLKLYCLKVFLKKKRLVARF